MSSYGGITLLLFVLIDGLSGQPILACGTLTASRENYSEGDTVVIQFTPTPKLNAATYVHVRNWMMGTREHAALLYNSSATNNNLRYKEHTFTDLNRTLSIESVTIRDRGGYYLVCKQLTNMVKSHWMYSENVTINITIALKASTKAPTTSAGHLHGQSDQGTLSITLIAVISATAVVVFVTMPVIVILIVLRRRRKTVRPTVSVEHSRRQSSTQDQGVAYEDLFIVQPQTQQYEVLQMTPQVPEGDVVSSDQGDDHQYIYVQV